MLERRSLKLPIALGVTMIVLIVLLIVGWVLLTVFGAMREQQNAPVYWTLLPAGIVLLAVVLLGVVIYLALSIKAINLGRRQANFIDSVTHELKSPLASLKLYLQTMKRPDIPREQLETFRRTMLDDVERLDKLIDHLLEAGRINKPTISEPEAESPTEISSLLQNCIAAECIRHRMDPEFVTVDLKPCLVAANRADLHMMFRNLIDNAIKYAGSPPRVNVQVQMLTTGHAVVRVSDNGRGIPTRERRKIFRRFVRLGLELERDKQGTGLGLYIVRTIVQRVGGRIRIREPKEGTGSVFEVIIPALPADRQAENDGHVSESATASPASP